GPEMRVGAVDEELLVAWCRIGDRLRMTSSAEFTGYETTYAEHDLRLIRKLANDLLPDAAEYDKGTYRACNRPMTPDGPPILGQAGPDNLYINSGHGHMGFTMASGSSRIVADLIDGKKPDIPVEGLTLTSRPCAGSDPRVRADGKPTSVDHDRLSGHEGRLRAREVDVGAGDLVGLCNPALGRPARDGFEVEPALRLQPRRHLSAHIAWRDGVDADRRRPLRRHDSRHHHDRRLARPVSQSAGERREGLHRRCVDDH